MNNYEIFIVIFIKKSIFEGGTVTERDWLARIDIAKKEENIIKKEMIIQNLYFLPILRSYNKLVNLKEWCRKSVIKVTSIRIICQKLVFLIVFGIFRVWGVLLLIFYITYFCSFQNERSRPKWTLCKYESDRNRKCLSVGNFGILI